MLSIATSTTMVSVIPAVKLHARCSSTNAITKPEANSRLQARTSAVMVVTRLRCSACGAPRKRWVRR
jgi:hypothetical protein